MLPFVLWYRPCFKEGIHHGIVAFENKLEDEIHDQKAETDKRGHERGQMKLFSSQREEQDELQQPEIKDDNDDPGESRPVLAPEYLKEPEPGE